MTPRATARLTLVSTLILSIAAQIAHAFAIAGAHGPSWGALVESTAWPLLTLAAVEIAVRTPWGQHWSWQVIRWAGVGGVALVAAIVSYVHLSGLLRHYHEPEIVCLIGPLAVDGLGLSAAAALIACDRAAGATSTMTEGAPTLVTSNQPIAPHQHHNQSEATSSVTPCHSPDNNPLELVNSATEPEPHTPNPTPDTPPATLAPEETEPTNTTTSHITDAKGNTLGPAALDKRDLVIQAIQEGNCPPQPTAAQILKIFGGAGGIARQVRDSVAHIQPHTQAA